MAGTLGAGPGGPLRAEVRVSRREEGSQTPSRGRRLASACEEAGVPAGLWRLPSFSRHHHVMGSLISCLHRHTLPLPPTLKLWFSKYGVIFKSEVVHGGLCLEPFCGGALGSVLSKSELFMFQCILTLLDGDLSLFVF